MSPPNWDSRADDASGPRVKGRAPIDGYAGDTAEVGGAEQRTSEGHGTTGFWWINDGDAYYVAPGHTPILYAGTEVIEFSPTPELQRTLEVVEKNMAASG